MADPNHNNNDGRGRSRNKKKKKKSRGRKRVTPEQIIAMNEVYDWAFPQEQTLAVAAVPTDDGFSKTTSDNNKERRVVFEFHSHSTYSDGYLSPSALVDRAHQRGVKVLALTDHDTMGGVPDAVEAAQRVGIRIIPGVEISTMFQHRDGSGSEEPVHILAYYSGCGPSKSDRVEKMLSDIRDGRYHRAKSMLTKLRNLKMPLVWENLIKIAGDGVAPGRLHVARAMVEAGHVENIKEAFDRYLHDDGPAYAKGSEPPAEETVELIHQTGGVAVLAHPWALNNHVAVISALKTAGIHAVEVYRNDGKMDVFSDLCDKYELMKLGGSDYHGKGAHGESDLGSVNLPVSTVHKFLSVARPIWSNSMKDTLTDFTNEPTDANLEKITRFGKMKYTNKSDFKCVNDVMDSCLSYWLTNDERTGEFEELSLKFSNILISRKN